MRDGQRAVRRGDRSYGDCFHGSLGSTGRGMKRDGVSIGEIPSRGCNFRDYHLLLDEQAEQIFTMTDAIAERAARDRRSHAPLH